MGSADEMLRFCMWCVDEPDSVCFHPGHLRLSDFGLSRRLKRGGRAFTICGTMQYMGELCGQTSWGMKHCWWLMVCRLTTVEPFCMLPLPWPTSAAVPQIFAFSSLKKEMHPFFSACVQKKTTFLGNHILSVLFLLFGPSSSRGFKRGSLQPCCWLVVPWHSVVCTSDGKGQITETLHLFIQNGLFFIVSSLHLSVSSTRRARSHHHVEQGQKLSLRRPQVLQLHSDLAADWGVCPPPEYPSLLGVVFKTNVFPSPPCWCSFFVKAQPTVSVTWSVSRCSPSSAAFPSTLSSFKRHLLTSSCSSGPTLIGLLKQGGAFHQMI